MRIIRYSAKQGHPVPSSAQYARGPFPPELFKSAPIITDYESQPDGGGDPIPKSGTAQNGFKPDRLFRCRSCREVLIESELESHTCEEVSPLEIDLEDDIDAYEDGDDEEEDDY